MADAAPVAVAMVSHDSAGDLERSLAAVGRLDPAPAELVVVDCASADESVAVARRCLPAGLAARLVPLEANLGFAGGSNRAVAESASPWVLTLNPDAEPEPDFLARLLERERPRAGAITGRLLRPGEPPRLDACGMRLTRSWRHLDRGSGEPDLGQYDRPERVFGATGAASLWRRAALDDVALDGRAFDERFHSYREDAELSLRLAGRGWEVVYVPAARCLHRRRVTPRGRRALPPAINRQSLVNRYLLRTTHQSGVNLIATLPWTLGRDLGALAWVLLFERSSFAAYLWLWRHRVELAAHRRAWRARLTEPRRRIERWFALDGEPV